jgi:hypothetical protein
MPLQPSSLLGTLLLLIGAAWLIYEIDAERRKGPMSERRDLERSVYAEDLRVWGGRLKVTTVVGGAVLIVIGLSLIYLGFVF